MTDLSKLENFVIDDLTDRARQILIQTLNGEIKKLAAISSVKEEISTFKKIMEEEVIKKEKAIELINEKFKNIEKVTPEDIMNKNNQEKKEEHKCNVAVTRLELEVAKRERTLISRICYAKRLQNFVKGLKFPEGQSKMTVSTPDGIEMKSLDQLYREFCDLSITEERYRLQGLQNELRVKIKLNNLKDTENSSIETTEQLTDELYKSKSALNDLIKIAREWNKKKNLIDSQKRTKNETSAEEIEAFRSITVGDFCNKDSSAILEKLFDHQNQARKAS